MMTFDEGTSTTQDLNSSQASSNRVVRRRGGLYRRAQTGAMTLVAPDLKVLARARGWDGDNWSRVLRFVDADGHQRITVVPEAAVTDPSGRLVVDTLTRQGYDFPSDPSDRKLVLEYLRRRDVDKRARIVRANGWTEGWTYVVGERTYGGGDDLYLLDPEIDTKAQCRTRAGRLRDWKKEVGHLLSGNHLGIATICAAFAGPLLKLLDMESGGLQLFGPTSIGKSALLASAAAITGRPSLGAMVTWSTTLNATDDLALAFSDGALVIDETGSAADDKRDAADVILAAIYKISGGVEKNRKHVGVGPKPTQGRWRVFLLSSSELPLVTLAAKANKTVMPGQSVRFVDVPADIGKGFGVFDRLPDGVASSHELARLNSPGACEMLQSAGMACRCTGSCSGWSST